MNVLTRLITPGSATTAAVVLVIAAAVVAPRVVYRMLDDGGFVAGGERINLARWTHITANRHGGAILGINRPDRDPPTYHESWINTGQWLRFDQVPITSRSRFVAEVRVHPAWPRDRAAPVAFTVRALREGAEPLVATVTPDTATQTEWSTLELDLSAFAGYEARIQLAPTAPDEVWTLMRNPRIELTTQPQAE